MSAIHEKVQDFSEHHSIHLSQTGNIQITGYSNLEQGPCFCIVAQGTRYHDYGIADGSLLFCSKAEPPKDGDLVIVYEGQSPAVYLYRPTITYMEDAGKHITTAPTQIYAVVLGSFNFYR